MHSQALVPFFVDKLTFPSKRVREVAAVVLGVILVSALAQVSIPLPWTPVPITGQTFGVTLLALLWGRKLGVISMLSYLILGGLGAPIFAAGKSGLLVGPTFGYLVGMAFSAYFIGSLADRGWSNNFFKAWAAGLLGSVFVFAFGLAVLSAFVPSNMLLSAGLWPFLPGDLVKTCLAATIVTSASKGLR